MQPDERIPDLLRGIETEEGVEILYACESGSRAWGFASPDSDYDIRFLYRRPLTAAYRIEEPADTIERPIRDDLDPGGWDLRKALVLLRRSNGPLIEWLHSPIVYRARTAFAEDLRALARDHLSPKALANHYRGLAQRTWQGRLAETETPPAKAYLYCLRAVLAARYTLDRETPPPVPFAELIPLAQKSLQPVIADLLAWKAEAKETASPGRIAALDAFLAEAVPLLASALDGMPDSPIPAAPYEDALSRWTRWPSPLSAGAPPASDFTLKRVREADRLLFECVSGSRAYGTHHDRSDTDLRGVFAAPPAFLCGLETIEQVSDERGDEVYYEAGRFIALLTANNPNLIELLFTPEDCVRHRHPAFGLIRPEDFLSKLCRQTFGNYAMGQVRKARGLNKKIVNPEPEQRRHLRDFCHVLEAQGSVPLAAWLERTGWAEEECGLVAVSHAPGVYGLFHDASGRLGYRGVFSKKDDAAVICSSVPKGAAPIAWIHCNLDAFKAHCRSHREYWEWVGLRNDERYQTNTAHGRGYDSKNLMHTLRLLDQAIEIARDHRISLPRPNAAWLVEVKRGAHSYDDLLGMAEAKHEEMEAAFEASSLPEAPDPVRAGEILLALRDAFASDRAW